MDGFNEKKWFVYLSDHHEGPFSLAEIQNKMSQSQVTSSNYVWAEGMTDWKPMTTVPEFEALLPTTAASGAPAAPALEQAVPVQVQVQQDEPSVSPMLLVKEDSTVTPKEDRGAAAALVERTGSAMPAASTHEATFKDASTAPELSLIQPNPVAQPVLGASTSLSGAMANAPAASPPARKAGSKAFKWVVLALIVGGTAAAAATGALDPLLQSPSMKAAGQAVRDFTQPQLLKLSEKVPALRKWVSPIPPLDDVSPEDYETLKQAAFPKLEEGAKLAVAVSTSDPTRPVFYVASNLPDGAVIDIYVEGVPDTLLNQLSFSGRTQATIEKKLGKSGQVKFADGKPLPRGEYTVYATEAAEQPDAARAALADVPPAAAKLPASLPVGQRLVASQSLFLGGVKDATYSARLKEFHDKLREKSAAELAEVKQLASTLEGQLASTSAKYEQLRKLSRSGKPSAAAKKGWNEFNPQWAQLDAQLRESFGKWTDQALATEYFYGILYAMTKSAGDAVEKLHQLQGDYFGGKTDPKAFEIQRGSALSVAQSALAELRSKITQAENLAPTPNGMPRREGL
jgi:hypothetical protein